MIRDEGEAVGALCEGSRSLYSTVFTPIESWCTKSLLIHWTLLSHQLKMNELWLLCRCMCERSSRRHYMAVNGFTSPAVILRPWPHRCVKECLFQFLSVQIVGPSILLLLLNKGVPRCGTCLSNHSGCLPHGSNATFKVSNEIWLPADSFPTAVEVFNPAPLFDRQLRSSYCF